MGIFHVDFEVLPANGGTGERQTALVDTGASYLSLPGSILRRLGYEPVGDQRVVFATGEAAIWKVAEVKVSRGARTDGGGVPRR